MDFAMVLPNLGAVSHPDAIAVFARRVEELDYHSIFVSDHLVLPLRTRSRYPYNSRGVAPISAENDILEPFTLISYLASITRRVRLGISVQVLPYRHPVLNAKMLTTLDVLTGGRVIVGVGVGWLEEEFQALNADYSNRGTVTDEHITNLQSVMHPEGAGFPRPALSRRGDQAIPQTGAKASPAHLGRGDYCQS